MTPFQRIYSIWSDLKWIFCLVGVCVFVYKFNFNRPNNTVIFVVWLKNLQRYSECVQWWSHSYTTIRTHDHRKYSHIYTCRHILDGRQYDGPASHLLWWIPFLLLAPFFCSVPTERKNTDWASFIFGNWWLKKIHCLFHMCVFFLLVCSFPIFALVQYICNNFGGHRWTAC